MVRFPNESELTELKNFSQPHCLTIYAPFTESDPPLDTNANRIAFKNILREAEEALRHHHMPAHIIHQTLESAKKLLDSKEFWPGHRDSLAVFLHPAFFRYYHLPAHGVPSVVAIRKGFYLVPLNEVMEENKSYYVLALSHHDVKLYEGTQYTMKPIEDGRLPKNMEDALRIDEYPQDSARHNMTPAGKMTGSKAFHGQYDKRNVDKVLLQQFFRKIDKQLHDFLKNKKAPLILAGVDYLLPMYKQVNTYPHLIKEHIVGNLEHANLNWTRDKAWSIVR